MDQGQLACRAGQIDSSPRTTGPPPLLSHSDWANFKAIAEDSLERLMAEHNEVAYTTADGNDYPAHEQTYDGFIKLVKYGTGSVILIVALMAHFPDLILSPPRRRSGALIGSRACPAPPEAP